MPDIGSFFFNFTDWLFVWRNCPTVCGANSSGGLNYNFLDTAYPIMREN